MPEQSIIGVTSLKLPQFSMADPITWFFRAEANFRLKNITKSCTKADHVMAVLPDDVFPKISVWLRDQQDEIDYEALKDIEASAPYNHLGGPKGVIKDGASHQATQSFDSLSSDEPDPNHSIPFDVAFGFKRAAATQSKLALGTNPSHPEPAPYSHLDGPKGVIKGGASQQATQSFDSLSSDEPDSNHSIPFNLAMGLMHAAVARSKLALGTNPSHPEPEEHPVSYLQSNPEDSMSLNLTWKNLHEAKVHTQWAPEPNLAEPETMEQPMAYLKPTETLASSRSNYSYDPNDLEPPISRPALATCQDSSNTQAHQMTHSHYEEEDPLPVQRLSSAPNLKVLPHSEISRRRRASTPPVDEDSDDSNEKTPYYHGNWPSVDRTQVLVKPRITMAATITAPYPNQPLSFWVEPTKKHLLQDNSCPNQSSNLNPPQPEVESKEVWTPTPVDLDQWLASSSPPHGIMAPVLKDRARSYWLQPPNTLPKADDSLEPSIHDGPDAQPLSTSLHDDGEEEAGFISPRSSARLRCISPEDDIDHQITIKALRGEIHYTMPSYPMHPQSLNGSQVPPSPSPNCTPYRPSRDISPPYTEQELRICANQRKMDKLRQYGGYC
eukprot:maker-scaffold733_size105121-snap-gene-0.17 protein:Tk04996 transcript:maker-scaffold733_size105121-snap-gene-0.17-mRNA-1 annotation:"PREDICTED: uncharacterized protein LOC103308205"